MLPASRRRSTLFLVLAIALLATACLPSKTAAGRPGPVRKVALLGDSLTFGLFGTTPGVADPLRERLGASGLSVTIDGGPGDTLQTPWPGHANWADLLQARIDQDDPDVVIIQSILFPGAENPANHDSYFRAAQKLLEQVTALLKLTGDWGQFKGDNRPAAAITLDQRGAARVGAVDIGAFELNNSANGGSYVAVLPSGLQNSPYSYQLTANNGPFIQVVTNGTLPNGIVLSTAAAPETATSLAGTPTVFGVFNFGVTSSSGANFNLTNYTLTVFAAAGSPVFIEGRLTDTSGQTLRVPAEVVVQAAPAPEILVLATRTFTLRSGSTLNVIGGRALAIAAHYDLLIGGTIDLSAVRGTAVTAAPGAVNIDTAACTGRYVAGISGGGTNACLVLARV